MTFSLASLFRRPARAARKTTIEVLKTRTCPLCEEAVHVLKKEQERSGFELRVRDITDAPELLAVHRDEVPVVFVDGIKRFIGRVDPTLLRRLTERA